jgi:hypothetical protein
MKRTAGLLVVFLLCSMVALHAQDQSQDKDKGTEMTGMLCNAANVVLTGGKATCDESKGGGSNDMVFIDAQGKATTIANPEKMKGMSGQKVKVKGEMKKINGEDRVWIHDLAHLSPG